MSSIETRSRLAIRADAVRRLILWRLFSGRTPYYLVSEFPKCGGSWVSQMLAAYLDVPFPRNENVSLLHRRSCILHGHFLYNVRFRNAVYVLRDGRDAMVSAYFHELLYHDRNPAWAVERVRAELGFADVQDVEENLPAFIEYKFTRWPRGLFHFTWAQFVDSLADRGANCIRYEDLLRDATGTMACALERMTGDAPDIDRLDAVCERFSFQRQARRRPGEENRSSFLRKGIAGDWKSKFTRRACEVFDRYAGDALVRAGYESDRNWVAEHASCAPSEPGEARGACP